MADAVDELYLEPFEDFVGARNELAKRLRAEGDDEEAKRVRALRKPSRVAWAIDQLSGREHGLRDALLDAGAELRDAQERLVAGKASSAGVREAAAREREAVDAALEAVGALAADAGSALSAAAAERARQTLHAVALDEDVRRDFEGHRLRGEHQAASLGGFDLEADGPAPKRTGTGSRARGSASGSGRDSGNDDTRAEAKRRREELKAAKAEVRKLEKRGREAEREAEAARKAAESAQRDVEDATEALETAQAEATAARERLEALGGASA